MRRDAQGALASIARRARPEHQNHHTIAHFPQCVEILGATVAMPKIFPQAPERFRESAVEGPSSMRGRGGFALKAPTPSAPQPRVGAFLLSGAQGQAAGAFKGGRPPKIAVPTRT